MRTRFIALAFLLAALWPASATAAGCQFVLGFASLHDELPLEVGDCTENEWYWRNATFQATTNGFLMYTNNVLLFSGTDLVWQTSPRGRYVRTTTEHLPWEYDTTTPQVEDMYFLADKWWWSVRAMAVRALPPSQHIGPTY